MPRPPRKNAAAFKGSSTQSVCMGVPTGTTWGQKITSEDTRLNFPSVEVLKTSVKDISQFVWCIINWERKLVSCHNTHYLVWQLKPQELRRTKQVKFCREKVLRIWSQWIKGEVSVVLKEIEASFRILLASVLLHTSKLMYFSCSRVTGQMVLIYGFFRLNKYLCLCYSITIL